MLLLTLYTFKDIKYIIIKNDELTYYSFLMIFGKTLNFRNYIGKIIVMETMCATSYEIVYLVDGQNRTALKIASVYYENFEEINDAIPLKKIRFSPNRRQYLKLLFIGKIKVEKKNKGYRRKIKTRNKKTTKI